MATPLIAADVDGSFTTSDDGAPSPPRAYSMNSRQVIPFTPDPSAPTSGVTDATSTSSP